LCRDGEPKHREVVLKSVGIPRWVHVNADDVDERVRRGEIVVAEQHKERRGGEGSPEVVGGAMRGGQEPRAPDERSSAEAVGEAVAVGVERQVPLRWILARIGLGAADDPYVDARPDRRRRSEQQRGRGSSYESEPMWFQTQDSTPDG
jgi:hypothetical protein